MAGKKKIKNQPKGQEGVDVLLVSFAVEKNSGAVTLISTPLRDLLDVEKVLEATQQLSQSLMQAKMELLVQLRLNERESDEELAANEQPAAIQEVN